MTPDNEPTSRDRMLESAIVLMKRSGLSGAGINQILAHSGAPKGSMYYHFPGGKIQIASEALRLYGQRVAGAFERILASKKKPADKIRSLFAYVASRVESGDFNESCAAGAVALDLQTDVAELQPVVAEVLNAWKEVLAAHMPQKTAAKRLAFAGLVISTIEGAYIRSRAERSTAPFEEAGQLLAASIVD